ncbi:hypothetical protein [Rhizobium sp. RAF56]|jgi:hypothetical protein|uniref:hypothetical protein n=1 Tax=Rhizobium sp. RAF56 TaxID=3233062 RepID=UPI003F99A801
MPLNRGFPPPAVPAWLFERMLFSVRTPPVLRYLGYKYFEQLSLDAMEHRCKGNLSMKPASFKLALWLLLAALNGTPAVAADAADTNAGAQEQAVSMREFISANPDCLELNDQCSFCSVVNGEAKCSTPQIACVKQAYRCTARSSK